jgi:hypothetical protein
MLAQKQLPEGIQSVGRWWGASRSVVNERLYASIGNVDTCVPLMEFCAEHGFPKVGTVVAECERVSNAWRSFSEQFS